MVLQSPRQQAKIHDARLLREMESIGCDQAAVSIGPFHEFVSKTGAPLGGKLRGLRQRSDIQPASILAANLHGKGVVEAKCRTEGESKSGFIFALDTLIHLLPIVSRSLFENRRQSGSRIFGVNIDASCQDGLLANVGACEVEAALHLEIGVRFNLLCDQFAKNE